MGVSSARADVVNLAGELQPAEVRSFDAIHLATAQRLGGDLGRLVTYDERLATAAEVLGFRIAVPG